MLLVIGGGIGVGVLVSKDVLTLAFGHKRESELLRETGKLASAVVVAVCTEDKDQPLHEFLDRCVACQLYGR